MNAQSLAAALVAFSVLFAIWAPTERVEAQTTSAEPTTAKLLKQLHDDDWTTRAGASARLSADPTVLKQQNVREGLLDLLSREEDLVENTLRESNEMEGVSVRFGEDFGEYVGALGEAVVSFADWRDPYQVCILVRLPSDPESQFAGKLVSHGVVALPCLLEMFKSDLGIVRGDAVVVMLRILSEPTKGFGHRATHQAKADVQRALHDPSVIVRMDIVSALGTFGAHDMIAALRHVAEADPGPEVQGHSVRKSALEAIAKIEQRSRKSAK